jgi:BlaI family penicillinase repressor
MSRMTLQLSQRELGIMRAMWRGGPMTAHRLRTVLPNRPDNSTVRTFLRILEAKGHVQHSKRGREFVYAPITSREQAMRQAVSWVAESFFDGSLEALAAWAGGTGMPSSSREAESGADQDVWLL